jgi:hypothetical protein
MNRRLFLLGASALTLAPVTGAACNIQANEECGVPVPNNNFAKGTVNRPADFTVKVCLPDNIWSAIQPQDGTSAKWVFRMVTFDKSGAVRWHSSKTVVGQQCHTQGVYKGTHVFVYVTCESFTGWLSTGALKRGGSIPLVPVAWDVNYLWLDNNFPSKL